MEQLELRGGGALEFVQAGFSAIFQVSEACKECFGRLTSLYYLILLVVRKAHTESTYKEVPADLPLL